MSTNGSAGLCIRPFHKSAGFRMRGTRCAKNLGMKTFQTAFLAPKPLSESRVSHRANQPFSVESNRRPADTDTPGFRERATGPRAQIDQLTLRQKEVLRLIAEGKANKQTAAELCISIKTVEKHRQILMDKLGIHGTVALTHFAIAAGVVECQFS